MAPLVGRVAELRKLREELDAVRPSTPRPGRCVVVSGPSGVGKTRLVGELVQRAKRPALFHAVRTGPAEEQLAALVRSASASDVARPERFRDILAPDWDTAWQLLAAAVGDDGPTIVVIDGFDRLAAADASVVGRFWDCWERFLAERPVLAVLIVTADVSPIGDGADDAPKTRHIALHPFNARELGQLLDLDPARAFEAHLATGGHPDIAAQWPTGADVPRALEVMLRRSPSIFEVGAELSLARRFGPDSQARAIVTAAGSGARSRSALARDAGLPTASLDRGLKQLIADGCLVVDKPKSLKGSREARYRVADRYLRFWFAAIAPQQELLARGDTEGVMRQVARAWAAYRRDAIGDAVRQAMDRLAGQGQLPGTATVGGFWTRFESSRVDLVGLDDAEHPTTVTFVGSIKWAADEPFDHYDLGELIAARAAVPGAGEQTPLVAVSVAGTAVGDAVAAALGPAELLTAWMDSG